jgi:preprotein translocase subunit SecY
VLAAFANAFRTPDLRKKIFFTLGILAVFRLGSIIPTPNVNVAQVDFSPRPPPVTSRASTR